MRRHFRLFTIGLVNDLDIYGIVANPQSSSTICFTAGIHGNEYAGPHAALNFLDEGRIPNSKRIWMAPLINPWGFIHGKREAEKVNLNRQFNVGHAPRREAGLLANALEREQFQFMHSIHEDNEADGFYLYYENPKIKSKCKQILEIAQEHMQLDTRTNIYGDKVESPGLIFVDPKMARRGHHAHSLEKWMIKQNVDCLTTETPTRLSYKQRVGCISDIMQFVVENF